jgi:RNA polymerase sigma-70 factor (ECF subfamily)
VCDDSGGYDVIDDTQLIQQTLSGDPAAYGRLVTVYQDRLFNSMVHVVGAVEEAEDVVQEAFVQAYVKLGSFDGRSAFFTWLYRIAFRLALNRRRSSRVEISLVQDEERGGIEPPDAGDSPDARMMREERAREIRAALNRLNEEYRLAIVLREMEGLSYEAIADILEISVGTVRSRLSRARSLMRQYLQDVRQVGEHE